MGFKNKLDKYFGMENPAFTVEQRRYMKRYASGALPFLISGLIFNIICITLVINNTIDLSKFGKTRAQELNDLTSRIGYVLKHSTPALLWLYLCVHAVVHVRVRSPAMDPLNNHEDIVLKANNILRNSVEQFILSLSSQLVLVTHLNAEQTLRYIPALSLAFILGRITFWLGYPRYRSFGFITGIAPTIVVIAYNCNKYLGLYF